MIDHQAHWYPRAFFDALLDRRGTLRTERAGDGYVFHNGGATRQITPRYFDLDAHLADLQAAGLDAAVVSATMTADLFDVDAGLAAELCELLNEEYAAAQRSNPGTFVGVAAVPLQDVDRAVAVLERAVCDLGLRGVSVLSNRGGRPVADEETLRFYRRVEALGVPLFLHPRSRSIVADRVHEFVEGSVGWMLDSSVAALSLVLGGTLDACPDLVVVHPHNGGVLPYLADRLEYTDRRLRPTGPRVVEQLRTRFYTDTVANGPTALALGAAFYGAGRMLFGSDYPYGSRADALDVVRRGLPAGLAATVLANTLPALAPR